MCKDVGNNFKMLENSLMYLLSILSSFLISSLEKLYHIVGVCNAWFENCIYDINYLFVVGQRGR